MAFDYRQFLAENKLTKVSKGRESGKAQILSEGLRIAEGFDTEMDDADLDEYRSRLSRDYEGNIHDDFLGYDPGDEIEGGYTYGDYTDIEDTGFSPDDVEEPIGNVRRKRRTFNPDFYPEDELEDMGLDEANKQKEDYLKTKEREEKGNWPGSVGAFVEKHGQELGKAAINRQTLVDYVNNIMKPELNDEAKAYVDNLIKTTKSSFKLLQSLYNAHLAGVGLNTSRGSLRERTACSECGGWDETEEVAWEDDGDEYPVDLQEMAMNHASLGGERHRKKPGVKPGSAGQDKMAKSEMSGEKIEVTIGDVKKSVPVRAYKKYRKMTDSEEKKAWKKKYGFIQ